MMHDTDSTPARPVTLTTEDVHNLLSLIDALNEAAEGDSNDAEIDAGHALAGDLLAMLTPSEPDTEDDDAPTYTWRAATDTEIVDYFAGHGIPGVVGVRGTAHGIEVLA